MGACSEDKILYLSPSDTILIGFKMILIFCENDLICRLTIDLDAQKRKITKFSRSQGIKTHDEQN